MSDETMLTVSPPLKSEEAVESYVAPVPTGIGDPMTIPASEGQCVAHTIHVPEPAELHKHHVIPLWMQKEFNTLVEDDSGNLVLLCPTGHSNVHWVLSRLIRGETPLGRRGKVGQLARVAYRFWREYSGG